MGSGGVGRVLGGRPDGVPVKKTRDSSALYPIRAVSKLTGLGIDTLRAWERRHGAVAPVRDDRGRMYTDADIARLRLLRGAVEHGHSIGRLAGLTDAELRRLAATAEAAPAVAPPPRTSLDTAALTVALQKYDGTAIDQQIQPPRGGSAAARTASGRVDAGAGAGGRRMAPRTGTHRA